MADPRVKIVIEAEDKSRGTFDSAAGNLNAFGKTATSVGKGLSLGLTAPLLALGGLAFNAGSELNAGMADVASLSIASERVTELKANVQDMQIQFGKSAEDLTSGLYQVISAFGDSADAAKELDLAVKAGVAGRASTSEALALISAETKGYGDTSLAAQQKVADLGLKTVELGKTTLPELASSIGMVTSMSAQLGISQEELHAGASALSGVIGTTSQVFTGQRGVMQSLLAPTDSMTSLMAALNYKNGEAMVKGLGWSKTLQVITTAAKASGMPLQSFIGSIEGQNYALALTGAQLQKYTSDLDALGNSTGKTDAAYAAQTQGVNKLAFTFEQGKQKIQVFLEKLSDGAGPALLAFADLVTPMGDKLLGLADAFSKLDPSTQKWIVGLAGAAAGVGPLLMAIGAIAPAIGMLMGPVGLVIAGVGLLSAAWINDWGGIQEKTQSVIDFLRPGFGELMSWISAASQGNFGPLKAGLQGALQSVSATIQAFKWADFVTKLDNWSAYIKPVAWNAILPTLTGWGDYIKSLDWKQIIVTAIDWAMWIPALDWALFVGVLDWTAKIGAFVWSEWISKINWAGYVPSFTWSEFVNVLSWVGQLPSLAWSDFISHLEWLGVVDKVSWNSYISSLTWANSVTALSDWGTYIASLDWKSIITTTIDWATWVPALAWNGFVFTLNWATYLTTLDWGGKVSSVNWGSYITMLSNWGSYIVSLDWGGYVTRLASWSSFIGAFAWSSFISKLDWPSSATTFAWSSWVSALTWPDLSFSWSSWLEKLGWDAFVSSLTWSSFVPSFTWSSFITAIDLRSYIPSFPGWSSLMGAVGLGGGSALPGNATGTSSWRGGVTSLGERGWELLQYPNGQWAQVGVNGPIVSDVPAGTKIYSHEDAVRMMGGAGIMPIAMNAAGTTKAPVSGDNAIAAAMAWGSKTAGKALEDSARKAGRIAEAAAQKASDTLKAGLQSTPGLFHTSQVTQQQMDLAKLGVPQNFADDWIRHLTDEVVNGVQWSDADIKDAATRAGIDPSLPAKAILDMVTQKWNDSSLFADKKNLDLINVDAVKKNLADQAAAQAGQANIMAMFGIKPDQVQAQAAAVGAQWSAGIAQGAVTASTGTDGKAGTSILGSIAGGMTPEAFASMAGQLSSGLLAAIGDDKSTANADLAAIGPALLGKISDSWANVTGIDLISKLASAINLQLGTDSAIQTLKDMGGKIFKIVFEGWDLAASGADYVTPMASASSNATKKDPLIPGNATGTTNWRGGLTWVGENGPELVNLSRGSQVFSNHRSMAMAGAGGGTVNNYYTTTVQATVDNTIDIVDLAFRVAAIIQRKANR